MFSDRLELSSPGALPNGLSMDDMTRQQSTRNKALVSILARMPVRGAKGSEERRFFMEGRGDGISIIMRRTEELTGEKPAWRLLGDSELCLTIPAAQEHAAARPIITAWSGGELLPGADLLLLFPNKTGVQARTDNGGLAQVELYTTNLPMTVLAAAPGYMAYERRKWTPSEGALAVELQLLPRGGSVIFQEATGSLPGLAGCLSLIRDKDDRTYLNASSIAINDGQQQPVYFSFGEELRLTDANGASLLVTIVAMVGRAALLEYRIPAGD